MGDTSPQASAPHYRSDIQGLRAIAVLSVVIYHADKDLLGGGFIGVDIFFVISGFLITGILHREIQEKRISILGFYARRARRLFPALFFMLAASTGFAWLLLGPSELREFAHTLTSATFFLSNFDFFRLSGYFAGDSALKPLLHTWSLAVEEQFYILFPMLLLGLARFRRGVDLAVLAALFFASLFLSAWLALSNPSAAFFLLASRAFELLLGALLALGAAPAVKTQAARDRLSALGIALIVLSLVLINDKSPLPGLIALAPCAGAGLILHAGQNEASRGGRWLSTAPLLFFGALSYSLYLWHWPLLVFARHLAQRELSSWEAFAVAAFAVGIAYLSYRWIERPILNHTWRPARTLFAAGALMSFSAVVGLLLYLENGFPHRFSDRALALFDGAQDFNPHRECAQGDQVLLSYSRNCVFGSPVPPTTAVWGDSFAGELAFAVGERLRADGQSVMEISATRCPPAPGFIAQQVAPCAARNEEALQRLIADPNMHTVVLIANLAAHAHRPQERRSLEAGYIRAVSALLASHKRVILVAQVPMMPSEPPLALGRLANAHQDLMTYGSIRREHDRRSAWANHLVRTFTGATVVDPSDTLCDQSMCRAVSNDGSASLYWDRAHLSLTGARLITAHLSTDQPPRHGM